MVGTNYGPPVQKRRALVLHFDEAKFLGHWFLCVSRRGGHSAPAHACPTGCCLGPRWSPAAMQLAGDLLVTLVRPKFITPSTVTITWQSQNEKHGEIARHETGTTEMRKSLIFVQVEYQVLPLRVTSHARPTKPLLLPCHTPYGTTMTILDDSKVDDGLVHVHASQCTEANDGQQATQVSYYFLTA